MAAMPGEDALSFLVEQERRSDIIGFLREVVSLRLPNGKLCLDSKDRRILTMYIMGYPQRSIASKVNIAHKNVLKRISMMPKKILKCEGGHLVGWDKFLEPPQSDNEADVPEVMLRWCIDSAEEAYGGSYWGKSQRKRVWKTKVVCKVPEYFQRCFGDSETKCTLCGVQCTIPKMKP